MYEIELNNKLENLKKEFVNSDLSFDDEILKILSTKTDKNQIFHLIFHLSVKILINIKF